MVTRTSPISAAKHFDVFVVSAGLSGIGAGYHLQSHCSGKRYSAVDDGVLRFSSPMIEATPVSSPAAR